MTKAAPLPSLAEIKDCLGYDPATGEFIWLKRVAIRVRIGDVAGRITHDGYRSIRLAGRNCRAHRLAWKIMTGRDPGDVIDHVNGIRDDNRWENLREVTQAQNLWNIRTENLYGDRAVTSKYTGVSRVYSRKGVLRWQASIMANGKATWLGAYDTQEEARDAYLKAKAELHRLAA